MYQRSIDSIDRGKSVSSLCQFLIRFSISREANGDILHYLPSSFPPTPSPPPPWNANLWQVTSWRGEALREQRFLLNNIITMIPANAQTQRSLG